MNHAILYLHSIILGFDRDNVPTHRPPTVRHRVRSGRLSYPYSTSSTWGLDQMRWWTLMMRARCTKQGQGPPLYRVGVRLQSTPSIIHHPSADFARIQASKSIHTTIDPNLACHMRIIIHAFTDVSTKNLYSCFKQDRMKTLGSPPDAAVVLAGRGTHFKYCLLLGDPCAKQRHHLSRK